MNGPAPSFTPTFSYGQATDRGLRRALNEDSLLATDRVIAIADGMGGHEAGEVASALCLKLLDDGLGDVHAQIDPEQLEVLLERTDQKIIAVGAGRAGTTLSGAVFVDEASHAAMAQPQLLVFNIGDSRTYLWSHDELQQVSIDHSEVQEMVDSGQLSPDEAASYPRRHVITRALGINADSQPDFWLLPVSGAERILVCSDGLSSEVSDEKIREILAYFPDPQQAAEELVQAALAAGGRDNISVIVADVQYGHPDDVEVTVPRLSTTSHTEEKS
ncbi:serine/threonine protein phosphatase [Arthrobacter sp. EpRS66]|nr:serine/threonine protein phosphatase [Arthrobacter sp. EpRS66]